MRQVLSCLLLFCTLITSVRANDKVVFTPQWIAQAQFAGYYVALYKGFYNQQHLDVTILYPSTSSSSLQKFTDNQCQFATFQLLAAYEHRQKGLNLVNILQTSQSSMQCIVSHHPVKSPKDLAGKKFGGWLSGYNQLGHIMNDIYGLHLQWIPFISSVNLFNIGAIDATMAQTYNEYFQILSTGEKLGPENVLRMADIGLDVPEDGLYVKAEYYRKHPDIVRRFRKASRDGWIWAYRHPNEALDIVMQVVHKNKIRTNRTAQKWMLQKILRSLRNSKTGMVDTNLHPSSVDFVNRLFRKVNKTNKAISYQELTRP